MGYEDGFAPQGRRKLASLQINVDTRTIGCHAALGTVEHQLVISNQLSLWGVKRSCKLK
jgi:hypothetical protein